MNLPANDLPPQPRHVWIDTDMGFDDLAAVLTIAQSPGWIVDGMSLVAGNAPIAVVADNAARSAALFGWHFPIHVGSAEPLACALMTAQHVLGEDALVTAGRSLPPTRAPLTAPDGVTALSAYLAASSTPATVLAIGPLTNIARVLADRPMLAERIGRLMWMGGSVGPGNHSAAAEFNAAVDPESINVVLDAGVRIDMVGLDACRQVRVHARDAEVLRAVGTEAAEILADLLLGYVRIAGAGADGGPPMWLYDPTAAAALVAPDSVTFVPARMIAECRGEHTRGMTVVEFRVPRRGAANATVATSVDEEQVRRVVLDGLAAAARSGRSA